MSYDGDKPVFRGNLITSPARSLGLVTSLDKADLPVIQRAMQVDAEPIMTAGILPPDRVVRQFATNFPPQTPFSYILLRLHELSRMHPRYHLCELTDQLGVADVIQSIKDLTIDNRLVFCAAPAMLDPNGQKILRAYAQCVAAQKGGDLLDITELDLEILERTPAAEKEYLQSLESLHKALVLYLWLSYRFAGVFTSQPLAFHVKSLTEKKIDEALDALGASGRYNPDRSKKPRDHRILRDFLKQVEAGRPMPAVVEHDHVVFASQQRNLPALEIGNGGSL